MLLTKKSSTIETPLAVILLGPPGSGKGTHAAPLAQRFGLRHISTGDLFRENMRAQTPLGKQARVFIDEGKLVPDEITLEMLFDRISRQDCRNGIILDGCPRTIAQAEALEQKIGNTHQMIILQFSISDELLIDRIAGRIACVDCGTPFHKIFTPPKNGGICDACGGILYQRADDTEATLRTRLAIYNKETAPLIAYYQERDLLRVIDSSQNKSQVLEKILQVLRSVPSRSLYILPPFAKI